MNSNQLLNKLTDAVSFKFADDKTSPGITVSKLKNGYYCSIVRYNGAFAREKEVVCNATGSSLTETLKSLATNFVTTTSVPRDPFQELQSFVMSTSK